MTRRDSSARAAAGAGRRAGGSRTARRLIGLAAFAVVAAVAVALAPAATPPGGGGQPSWTVQEVAVAEVDRLDAADDGGDAVAMRRRIDAARRWAAERPGVVSFALVGRDGRVRGHREGLLYPSASVVKAMLLTAEMQRLRDGGLDLDGETRATLRSMITYSDNDAADLIYARVGDAGLLEVAERAGMERFSVADSWGYAQIDAADMALLFAHLDRALPGPEGEFAKGLLGSVVPEQSWGIPAAAPESWAVRFKGGWRGTGSGQLVHQAAELRDGDRTLGLAVLTDAQPSMETGIETIEGVATRLIPADQPG